MANADTLLQSASRSGVRLDKPVQAKPYFENEND
jgi:hypothetical protein